MEKILGFIICMLVLAACGSDKAYTLKPTDVASVILVQTTHPYVGKKINEMKLPDSKISEFLHDFQNKTSDIIKFYGVFYIKIKLKNGLLKSYRTNGHAIEVIQDKDASSVYYYLNGENLITKYWGIPKDSLNAH
jgi:hypothetical protein